MLMLTSKQNNILICLCVEMTAIRKLQTPENYNKHTFYINQFAFIWYFFHVCSFYRFVALFLAKFWKCMDLNDDITKWRKIISIDCSLARGIKIISNGGPSLLAITFSLHSLLRGNWFIVSQEYQTGCNCVLFSGVDFESERISTLLSGRTFWLSWENSMGFYARKPDFVAWEQQRCRSACAFTQSDQRLCHTREPLY